MKKLLCVVVMLLAVCTGIFAQTPTGSITGTVVDAQGGVVPDAKVTVQNVNQKVAFDTVTNEAGLFVFPRLMPATYILTVEKEGFKKLERRDLVLNSNMTLSAGNIALEVGALSQTVEVTAVNTQLQATTSEQATSITGTQIENIQVNGRSFLALLTVVPGVLTDGEDFSRATNQTGSIYSNGTRGGSFNVSLNGASNLDTGSNSKMMATASLDSLQEVRVLTSNFDAQYGKNSGVQILAVTKSGTQQFHGAGYWYYRDRGLNATSWMNNRDNIVKPAYHFNYFGYNIGGPIYIPGKLNRNKNKLFFFWSEEYQRQLMPEGVRNVTVPTALERKGDFSQTLNITGSTATAYPYVMDRALGLPCNSSNTSGCFQDQGVVGKIPASRLYGPGLALLNVYPLPNISGQRGFNYRSQISSYNPRHEQLLRTDYYATPRWSIYGSLTRLAQDVVNGVYCPSGYSLCPNFPFAPLQYDHPGYAITLNAVATISPSSVNEFQFDIARHDVSVLPTDPNAFTAATTGVNLPTLFPRYADWIPRVSFNNDGRLSNAPSFDTGGGEWTPFNSVAYTWELIDNYSKTFGTHFFKAGFYYHRNVKDQSAYAKTSGHYDFGTYGTGYDTTYSFANAAIGAYHTFVNASRYLMGQYRYTNAEFYAQDSWRARRNLTINYGVRGAYVSPYADANGNMANFIPSKWSADQAPRLYLPVLNSAGTKVGIDPATGQTVGSSWVGYVVPNSGNTANGLIQAGKGGINEYAMKVPPIQWGPRVGIAWDVNGRQNLVVRAGAGMYFDRLQGNDYFNMSMNPPVMSTVTLYDDLAQNMASASAGLVPPSGIQSPIDYDTKVPYTMNYSFGVEAKTPLRTQLSVAYVGSISRHLLNSLNLNAIPYGTDWQPWAQDPTKTKTLNGSSAYSTDFLRPYRGYGDINLQQYGATANYNSMQVKLDRKVSHGLFLASAFTWSKCLATGSSDGSGFRIDNLTRMALYARCNYDVPLMLTFNYVYQIPGAKRWGALNNVLTRTLFDGWQLSGLTQMRKGMPFSPGYSLPNASNQLLTGSNTQGARVQLVGDPLQGTTDSPYKRLNAAAFLPPQVGSIGIESPYNYVIGPGVNNWQMSVQRNIRIREKASIQIRWDAFNVFNHTQFSGLNSTVNFGGITCPATGSCTYNTTVTNLPYDANGNFINKNGFGTVNGVRSPRVMQAVVRFVF